MKEIVKNLFIGSQDDYELQVKSQNNWFVIHACKEPYHRQALGYTGRAASKDHPEYLIAKRKNRLILNLVDVDNPAYISELIIDEAIKNIVENVGKRNVLLHCNQGCSRSATIGLLYLHYVGVIITDDYEEAEQEYLQIYPFYNPANGMRMYAKNNWNKYKSK